MGSVVITSSLRRDRRVCCCLCSLVFPCKAYRLWLHFFLNMKIKFLRFRQDVSDLHKINLITLINYFNYFKYSFEN